MYPWPFCTFPYSRFYICCFLFFSFLKVQKHAELFKGTLPISTDICQNRSGLVAYVFDDLRFLWSLFTHLNSGWWDKLSCYNQFLTGGILANGVTGRIGRILMSCLHFWCNERVSCQSCFLMDTHWLWINTRERGYGSCYHSKRPSILH